MTGSASFYGNGAARRQGRVSAAAARVRVLVAAVSEGAVDSGVGGVGALVDAGDAVVTGGQGALELRGLPLLRCRLLARALLGGGVLAVGGGAVESSALVALDPLTHRRSLARGRGRSRCGHGCGRGSDGSRSAGDRAGGEWPGGGARSAHLGAVPGAAGAPGADAGAQLAGDTAGSAADRAADAALQGAASSAQRAGEG